MRRFTRLTGPSAGRLRDALADELNELYAHASNGPLYSPDAKSAGRRALRNAALTLLTARGTKDDYARLEGHYRQASNMTDTAHALYLIAGVDAPGRAKILANFFERWKDDHLVIDMWFAAQAQSPRDETLDQVKALCRHPLFKITTPNKVRALIGTFAAVKPVAVQSRRWCRLRLPGRQGSRDRSAQSAGCGAHARRIP